MATSSFFSENPVSLLAEAVDSCRGCSSDFLEKVIRGLFEEALRKDPSVVSFPDGRSILVEAAKIHAKEGDEPLWVSWWKSRGPEAWLPTPQSPAPLVDFIRINASLPPRRFWATLFHDVPTHQARQAFLDGLLHAMPLSVEQAKGWSASVPLNDSQSAQVLNQEVLVEYCLYNSYLEDQLSPKFKIKALIDAGGVVPQSTVPPSESDFIYHYPAGVMHRLLDASAFGGSASNVWPQWWEGWVKSGHHHSSERILKSLQKAGIDTFPIEKKAFISQVLDRVSGLVQKKASIPDSWQAFDEIMSSRPDAWTMGDESGLLWHRALQLHPGLVTKAISAPKIDWAMSDSNGHGIWDYLSSPALRGGLSATTLKRLVRVAPLDLTSDSTPLFWHYWNPKQGPSVEVLLEETFAANPGAWLGSKSQQRRGAIGLAVDLYSNNERASASAAVVLNALFSPKLDRALFCQDLITIMTVVQTALEGEAWLKSQVPNAVDFPIQSPGPHRLPVVESLKKKLLSSDGPSSRQQGAIVQACLSLSLPKAAPAPARLRF